MHPSLCQSPALVLKVGLGDAAGKAFWGLSFL